MTIDLWFLTRPESSPYSAHLLMNTPEYKNKKLIEGLFGFYIVVLIVLKLLQELHLSWLTIFLPIWLPILYVLVLTAILFIYIETLGKLFPNDDGIIFTTVTKLTGLSFILLFCLCVLFQLNEVFQWTPQPEIEDIIHDVIGRFYSTPA